MLNSLQFVFRKIPIHDPNEGTGITWKLFLESAGWGGAVGSGKEKMVRNNIMVKSVESAKWSQNMSTYLVKSWGRDPKRVLILATVNDT